MNLVVDTHPLVWHLTGRQERLSRRARVAFSGVERGRVTLHVPAIVLMEIVLLEQLGRVRGSYADLRRQLDLRPTIRMEPLLPEDVDEARALAGLRDPFDRMIAGTALRLGLPLLTRDEAMTKSSRVRTWW